MNAAALDALRLHPADTVAVALRELDAGATVLGVRLHETIPTGHKFALQAIAPGMAVVKLGHVIGSATTTIAAGAWVHVHNIATSTQRHASNAHHTDGIRREAQFMGYRREQGRAGTRNYIGILTSVNCSATVARRIARHFEDRLPAGVDGVVALTHTTGCGMANADEGNEGLAVLRRTLGGYARHPNFAGVLLIGLGCEVNQVPALLRNQGLEGRANLRTLGIQQAGGAQAAIEAGIATVSELLAEATRAQRTPCPASELVLGLQCGGSDGWSGVSANPVLGAAADRLVAAGGTVLLGETPEIHGAEHLLEARATSEAVREALRERLAWWQDYTARNGVRLDNNPSPGNIAGGISTILEKSLGAVAKSGTSPLVGVLQYAEAVASPGFHFMDSPGYDPCSVTGEIASGANLVAFTTGRGSVFGAVPVPSLKLASNTALAGQMSGDMDIDCGPVLGGDISIDELGEAVFQRLLSLASGEPSKSELQGFGEAEFVPWQLGAVL